METYVGIMGLYVPFQNSRCMYDLSAVTISDRVVTWRNILHAFSVWRSASAYPLAMKESMRWQSLNLLGLIRFIGPLSSSGVV